MDITDKINRITSFLAENKIGAHIKIENADGEKFPLLDIILGAITMEMLHELACIQTKVADTIDAQLKKGEQGGEAAPSKV